MLGSTVALVRLLAERLVADESWTASVVSAAIGGLIIGLALGPLIARLNRRAREELATDDPDVVRRAARTARRGPVPDDAVLREQAGRMAVVLHEHVRRQRPWVLGFSALAAVAGVVLAVVGGSVLLPLLVVVPFGLLAGVHLLLARHFERRARLLGPDA